MAGQRPILPIPGHTGIHQTRIVLPQRVRADPESFGDAGPVDIDEGVGIGGQTVDQVPAAPILHVRGK